MLPMIVIKAKQSPILIIMIVVVIVIATMVIIMAISFFTLLFLLACPYPMCTHDGFLHTFSGCSNNSCSSLRLPPSLETPVPKTCLSEPTGELSSFFGFLIYLVLIQKLNFLFLGGWRTELLMWDPGWALPWSTYSMTLS